MAPPSFGCGFPKIFPRSGIIIMKITIQTKLKGMRKKVIN